MDLESMLFGGTIISCGILTYLSYWKARDIMRDIEGKPSTFGKPIYEKYKQKYYELTGKKLTKEEYNLRASKYNENHPLGRMNMPLVE